MRLAPVLALCSIVAFAGCTMQERATLPIASEAYVPGMPLAIDARNPNGSVIVTVDPTLDRPWVGARTIPGENIEIASSTMTIADGRATITANAEPSSPDAPPSTLTLRVPRCDGVRVVASGGLIQLTDVGPGAIDISAGTPGGTRTAVVVKTRHDIDGNLSVRNVAGPVFVRVGPGSRGQLRMTQSGEGTLRFAGRQARLDSAVRTPGSLKGRLNRGEGTFDIASEGGSATLEVMPTSMTARKP